VNKNKMTFSNEAGTANATRSVIRSFVEFRGKLALFPTPGTTANPSSFPVLTPTAAAGALRAIYWKPAMKYKIKQIVICSEPRWQTIKTNGVDRRAKAGDKLFDLEANGRSQMVSTYLVDHRSIVGFDIEANCDTEEAAHELAAHGSLSAVIAKHESIFRRRCLDQEPFRVPTLGTSECLAEFKLLDADAVASIIQEQKIKQPIWIGSILYEQRALPNYPGRVDDDWRSIGLIQDGIMNF